MNLFEADSDNINSFKDMLSESYTHINQSRQLRKNFGPINVGGGNPKITFGQNLSFAACLLIQTIECQKFVVLYLTHTT